MSGGRAAAASYAAGAACTSAGSPLIGGASCTPCARGGPAGINTGPPGTTGAGGAPCGTADSARCSGAGVAHGGVPVAAGPARGTFRGGPIGGAPVVPTGAIPPAVSWDTRCASPYDSAGCCTPSPGVGADGSAGAACALSAVAIGVPAFAVAGTGTACCGGGANACCGCSPGMLLCHMLVCMVMVMMDAELWQSSRVYVLVWEMMPHQGEPQGVVEEVMVMDLVMVTGPKRRERQRHEAWGGGIGNRCAPGTAYPGQRAAGPIRDCPRCASSSRPRSSCRRRSSRLSKCTLNGTVPAANCA